MSCIRFTNHPFKVVDDEAMMARTVESIAQFGVLAHAYHKAASRMVTQLRKLSPATAASMQPNFQARNVASHRPPAIWMMMPQFCSMVDSNLQRETILPSERAFAYIRHKIRLTGGQI